MKHVGPVPIVSANQPIACGSIVWRWGAELLATVVVKATFGMRHDAEARLLAARPLVVEDRYAEGGSFAEPSDFAPFLPGAGVMVWAHAHALAEPVSAMTVRLAVHRDRPLVDKPLHVFGDRSTGAPVPFTKMPIVWELAVGGADNPIGLSDDEPHVVSPVDATKPAGFRPIPPAWPARRRLLGALAAPDDASRGALSLPEGIDFQWFNAAPPDQQCEHLHGDEWIVLDGMHATFPRLQTRLPSVRAEAMCAGRPIEVCLDTLLIDADRQMCSLIWRGHVALDATRPAELPVVYVRIVLPGFPCPWPADMPAPVASTPLPSPLRAAPPAPPPAVEEAPAVEDEPDQTRMLDAKKAPGFKAPFAIPSAKPPRAEAPPGSPWSAPAALPGAPWSAAAAPPIATSLPGEATKLAVSVEDLLGSISADSLDDFAPTAQPSAPLPAPPPAAAPPRALPPLAPPVRRAPQIARVAASAIRATVEARLRAGEPIRDLDLAGADLRGLDAGGASLARIDLTGAKLAGCKLEGARLSEAKLAGADLTGADLMGADLTGCDLKRAMLTDARLESTVIGGADFTSAQGTGASFAHAKGRAARFTRGAWDRASFESADLAGADFTSASLDEARFDHASLAAAKLDEARGRGAVFDDAKMPEMTARGASFPTSSFRRADAPASIWESALLDGASFAGAVLAAASFARASCLGVEFTGADARGSDMQHMSGDGANMEEIRLDTADLRHARLCDARLDSASLRGLVGTKANLASCRFTGADLEGATLRKALCTGAIFVRANLERADLRDADLQGANMFGASRKTAKVGLAMRGVTDVDPGDAPR